MRYAMVFMVWCILYQEALAHDFYTDWKTKEGNSCCNSMATSPHGDCRPATTRVQGEKVEVLIGSKWVPVPREKIRPYQAPDLGDHVCHKGEYIFCVVMGGGV